MPTYVYECSDCDQSFEIDQRISAEALTVCQCGRNGAVKRVIQRTAVMFKGSGFYINDSAGTPAAETAVESLPAAPKAPSTE